MSAPGGTPQGDSVPMEERIAAIREREAKATPLPWKVCEDEAYSDHVPLVCAGPEGEHSPVAISVHRALTETFTPEDAEFIARAREDIPWLLARLAACGPREARLRAALERIVDLSDGWDEDGSTGPRKPLSWETVAMMAMDYARAALAAPSPDDQQETAT